MAATSRRQFLKTAGRLAAIMGMSATHAPRIALCLQELAERSKRFLWLQGLSCAGCSVSFLNTEAPDPEEVLTEYIHLQFHPTLSAATGHVAVDIVNKTIEDGDFNLIVEGAIPAGLPEACNFNHKPLADLLVHAATSANAVIAVGTCATYGGIPAAEGNPTGAVSVPFFLQERKISTPIIRLPGCPTHPDWIVGTLVHLLEFGFPELDEDLRPKMFYSKLLHAQCPRFTDYERENFAQRFSDDGCLFMLGCQGPLTNADCSLRLWNSGTNFCINARSLCYGCASRNFAAQKSFPFVTKDMAQNKNRIPKSETNHSG